MFWNQRSFKAGAYAFLAGLAVGVGTGLLFAPQSGSQTRRKIHDFIEEAQEDAEKFMKDTKETVSGWMERGKKAS